MAVPPLAYLLAVAVAVPCDPACERAAALEQIERGETRAAVIRLKQARSRFPDDPALVLALAKAYMAEDNLYWAEGTLQAAIALRPSDALSRTWLAWVHLRQGDLDLAASVLDPEHAPDAGPERAHWRLVEGFVASVGGEHERARQAVALVPRSSEVFAEDRDLWLHLQRIEDPWWVDPLSGSAEVSVGWTSNALAGAPTDPGKSGGGSGLARADGQVRLVPPTAGAIRPSFELSLRGHGIAAEEYRELSSFDLSGRAGGTAVWAGRRWLVAYRGELLLLDQEDSTYAQAHRLELESEGASGVVFFGGAGRRRYRDERRSRWEVDLGVGGPLGARGAASFGWGVIGRFLDASWRPYDQLGVSAVLVSRIGVGSGFGLRLAGTVSYDDYHNSGGREGYLAFGTKERRRDLLAKLGVQVWGPSWHGARPGLSWEMTRRESTASDAYGGNYSFREQRVLAMVRIVFKGDPWAPRAVRPADHVALDYGLADGADAAGAESIVELLRRDEELRRGSSCGAL